jgi:hypothetical protein
LSIMSLFNFHDFASRGVIIFVMIYWNGLKFVIEANWLKNNSFNLGRREYIFVFL